MDQSIIARLTAALAGRYTIVRELGAGGMATVFLADDLRHGRQIAIKVLHEDLGNTLGPERFLAEIKTTAKLQHPHILPLLDSGSTAAAGEAGGLLYYVMPYVEGETLRDRLEREKQLPIDDAVRIAREIADALGSAHAHGIVHRDIKPENILLQGDHALVADFGIALAVQHAGGSRMTQTGLSLGTPQYMAPEQAMGDKSVDHRSDQYALGAVTYEMLVGEPPFTGATVQAIVARVISSDPEPPRTVRKTIPEHVESAVLTALAKLPADRFASVAAFSAALQLGAGTTARTGVTQRGIATSTGAPRRVAIGAAAGLVAGLVIGFSVWRAAGGTADRKAVARSYLLQPRNEAFAAGTSDFALSLDGESLVYVGPGDRDGTTQLWRKRRSELHATPLSGTIGAVKPFFSPDGKTVAYQVSHELFKIPLDGGAPATVASGSDFRPTRGAWLDDGRIVAGNEVRIMSATGGNAVQLLKSEDIDGYFPVLIEGLPGSGGVIVQGCAANCSRSALWTVDLKSKAIRRLLRDAYAPTYLSTGHLLYLTPNGTAMVVAFDVGSLAIRGEAKPVMERVGSAVAVSKAGTLVYREGQLGDITRPVWVDRAGNATLVDTSWAVKLSGFGLSPDGKRLAVSVVTGTEQHIWLKELDRGPLSRLTFDAGAHFRPTWSADGQTLRFVQGDSTFGAVERSVNGSADATRIPTGTRQVAEVVESRNKEWLVLRTGGRNDPRDIMLMRHGTDQAARLVPSGPGSKYSVDISPDGRFIAYQTDVSKQPQVYVSPFPDIGAARWQVSLDGGTEPRWAGNGHELFYVSDKDEIIAAEYTASGAFAVKSRKTLFAATGMQRDAGFHLFEPAPGDQRFMMLRVEPAPGTLVVVDNWFRELADKLNSKK